MKGGECVCVCGGCERRRRAAIPDPPTCPPAAHGYAHSRPQHTRPRTPKHTHKTTHNTHKTRHKTHPTNTKQTQNKRTADADDVDRVVEVLHVGQVHRRLGRLLAPLLFVCGRCRCCLWWWRRRWCVSWLPRSEPAGAARHAAAPRRGRGRRVDCSWTPETPRYRRAEPEPNPKPKANVPMGQRQVARAPCRSSSRCSRG